MSTEKFNHLSDSHGQLTADDIDSMEGPVYETGDIENMHMYDDLGSWFRRLDEEIEKRSESENDWYLIPGNHDMTGEHGHVPNYDEVKEQVDADSVYEALTGKEGEDPEDAENLYDVVVAQHDGVEDVRDSVVEQEDHVVYFGGTHQDPELPGETGDRDGGFGYDFEEVAEELEEEDPTEGFGLTDYINPLNWGEVYKSFTGQYDSDVDPEDLDYKDVPDEMITEEHEEYREKKKAIEEKLEEHDKPVVLADHAVTRNEEWQHSSDINRDLAEKGVVDLVLGGHDHGSGEAEVGDAKVINSALGVSEVELDDGSYADHSYEQKYEGPTSVAQEAAQEQRAQQTGTEPEGDIIEAVGQMAEEAGMDYEPDTKEEAETVFKGVQMREALLQHQIQARMAPEDAGNESQAEA